MTDTEAGFQKGMHVMKEIYSTFRLGDMCAVYLLEGDTGTCGLTLLPWELKDRLTLEGWWNIEPVVQMKLLGDAYPDGFSHGHSMRNSATVTGLVYGCYPHQLSGGWRFPIYWSIRRGACSRCSIPGCIPAGRPKLGWR